jgi:hypothetical protein
VEIGIPRSRANCFWLTSRLSNNFSNRFRSLALYLRYGLLVPRAVAAPASVSTCSFISQLSWWINCDAIYRFNALEGRQYPL